VATGTAAVLRDLATEMPAARLDGFDISAKQFPQGPLPSNIALHLANCKQPFPAEFHGKFDVVYIRFLIAAMDTPQDWATVARNVRALLKPGGAIQWTEGQFSQVLAVRRQGPGATTRGLENFFQAALKAVGLPKVAWDLRGLGPIFESLGMVNVAHDVISSDCLPETRFMSTKTQIEVCYGILKTLKAVDAEELDTMFYDAMQDLDSGAYSRWDVYCHTCFKPT
jgi:hypothetical protein